MEFIRFLRFWWRYKALGFKRCWRERENFKRLVRLIDEF